MQARRTFCNEDFSTALTHGPIWYNILLATHIALPLAGSASEVSFSIFKVSLAIWIRS